MLRINMHLTVLSNQGQTKKKPQIKRPVINSINNNSNNKTNKYIEVMQLAT